MQFYPLLFPSQPNERCLFAFESNSFETFIQLHLHQSVIVITQRDETAGRIFSAKARKTVPLSVQMSQWVWGCA